jgi:hypothetical protein
MADGDVAARTTMSRVLEWLEVLAKLVGASAVLVVALFANSLQSKLTGVSIQSQREQAESQLRASMFASLIGPIMGPATDKPIPVDRELILTELLALNFNENFEMKPLMEDVIRRLNAERVGKKETGEDPREPLWSMARRISERQKATIAREWSASRSTDKAAAKGCEAYYLNLTTTMERHDAPVAADADCQVAAAFGDIVDLKSPDGNYTLRMVAYRPDFDNQTVRVSTQPFLSRQNSPKSTDTQYSFTMTWLDLPLTDNTILSDGNRFAAYLRTFYSETVSVTVMWFPKGYFTPRERPLNYTEVQQLLGKTQQ